MDNEQNEGERAFAESVRKFAEAYFALSEEEKAELLEYTQNRCKQAEQEYKKRCGKE